MIGYSNMEKSIKRFLKRKIKITLGLMVSFLITGIVSYSENIDKTVEIKFKNEKIVITPEGAGKLEGNTWTFNDTINVQNGNGVYISGVIKDFNLINNGNIFASRSANSSGNGIFIQYTTKDFNLINNGNISGSGSGINSGNGIFNNSGKIDTLNNYGNISGSRNGNFSGNGIFNRGTITTLNNYGNISGSGSSKSSGNGIHAFGIHTIGIINLNNYGIISGNGSGDGNILGNGIFNNKIITNLDNYGNISGNGSGESSGNGILNKGTITTLNNYGNISGNASEEGFASGNGICNYDGTIGTLNNYGIIAGSNKAVDGISENKIINKGLLISRNKIEAGVGEEQEIIIGYDKDSNPITETKYIINGVKEIKEDKTATANVINSSELTTTDDLIINVVGDTNTAFNINSDLIISNSIINGYKNAVVLNDGEFEGDNIIVNAGENAFTGSEKNDTLTLTGKSIINGKINLGDGNDILTINNTVQINSNLEGGDGEDKLSFAKSTDENINILHNISNFEKTTVGTKVTLFEKTKDENGDIQNLSAQLGDITIAKDGELILRIDGTDNSHALLENNGTISSTGGKFLFALNGVGEGSIIDLGNTKLDEESMKGNESGIRDMTLDTTSLLHNITKIDSSSVKVSTVENIPYVDIVNYNELNKIYQSIRSVDKVGSFNVDNDEKLTAFTKYLHDIYVANPYAYSAELSRKTMGIMRDIADKDLHPDLKEWAIFGGLTHIDGGTENSYYGKGYYSYDIGSRDISADTKITGAYVKGEYGKAEDLTLGVILGGNSSETEIESSKVEGDSFYLGGYAKKYLNNFRFTLGAGIHRGDYEADRVAVGYDGISETRKFSENYGDRGFNLYGNVKYSQELGNGFYFEPSVTLDYSYVDQEGVKESGDLAIDVDSEKFDYTSGIVNLDIRKEFVGEKAKHSLIAGVSYERILSGEDEKHITGRFKGGTDFDILVPEKEKDNFALNVKYEVETEKGILFDVKGSYKFENDNNKDQWIVGTGIGYRF